MKSEHKKMLMRIGIIVGFISFVIVVRAIAQDLQLGDRSLQIFEILALLSGLEILILVILWIHDSNTKMLERTARNRVTAVGVQYVTCPNCQKKQLKTNEQCASCNNPLILCKSCNEPFDVGSTVLIAPCCGEGFHREHFEVALLEQSKCPYCGSMQAIVESNW